MDYRVENQNIYVFEFKMDDNATAEDALKQINSKDYAISYSTDTSIDSDSEPQYVSPSIYYSIFQLLAWLYQVVAAQKAYGGTCYKFQPPLLHI